MISSHFLSAEKASNQILEQEFDQINSSDCFISFINTMPNQVAILNTHRQIVYGNEAMMQLLNVTVGKEVLGIRLGEALSCVNSKTDIGGCGTSEHCKHCGAANSFNESQISNRSITKECRITTEENGAHKFLDLKITTAPFEFKNTQFWIITVEDITDTNRRAALEKLFFHDILNIVGGLKGVSELLQHFSENEEIENNKYIDIINSLSKILWDEIEAQRLMVSAESGDLQLQIEPIKTLKLVEDVVSFMKHHAVSKSKTIKIHPAFEDKIIKSSSLTLKRILVNMIKNALEASKSECDVIVNCIEETGSIRLSVHNEGFMNEAVQAQVFQKSFSTKGKGRGLGTYSIKLLTERYLKGSVGFVSSKETGTEFYALFPIN